MAKRTANSYPADSINANIEILEDLAKKEDDQYRKDMYSVYFEYVKDTLEELDEPTTKPQKLEDCIAKLKEIRDKHFPKKGLASIPTFVSLSSRCDM